MKNIKISLVYNDASNHCYIEKAGVVLSSYKMDDTDKIYNDKVLFIGTLKDVIEFFKDCSTSLNKDIEDINNEIENFMYEYKYLIEEISEC